MPLPTDPKTQWPPNQVRAHNGVFDVWQAWYSGQPSELARVYGNATGYAPAGAFDDPNDGVPTALARHRERWFWGRRPSGADLADARLHVPLAGDIAAASADLLFAEPPGFTVDGEDGGPDGAAPKPTTDRIEMLMGDGGFMPVLIEAAEIASTCSGAYLRAGWVDDVADHVIIDAITPDHAVPEWRAGRLTAVTFWKVVAEDNSLVWRHLERHEAEDGVGRVLHGLYRGNQDVLGELVDLASHPATAGLATAEDSTAAGDNGLVRQIITGAERIAVEFVPNLRPPRKLRGTPYGRSDLDGIEAVLDAIDEVWSAWLRDIRIGKGRIIVPKSYLQNEGRGRGAVFDAEQAVYETVETLPADETGLSLQVVQFAIRVAEHRDTIDALVTEAVRGAGYSAQTFGQSGDVAATATEVIARERRSYTTRGRKIMYWRPALARLLETALQIDVHHFRPDDVTPVRPQIAFPDGVARDPMNIAQTVAMIHGAEAASMYTRIKMINPDWQDSQVLEEIDRIRADQKSTRVEIGNPFGGQPDTDDDGEAEPDAGQADDTAPASGGGAPSADQVPVGPAGPPTGQLVAAR